MPYLLLAPRQPWEPYGQACSLQTVHWLPKGLADYNPRSANPSDVWANDSAYHNPPPKVMAKRATTPLSGQNASLETKSNSCRPIKGRQLLLWFVMALFPKFVYNKLFCRSLRRERTRMAGIHFSSYKANVSFSPFAP